jgi:hypothetical protein
MMVTIVSVPCLELPTKLGGDDWFRCERLSCRPIIIGRAIAIRRKALPWAVATDPASIISSSNRHY